jgi:hypothetical protein
LGHGRVRRRDSRNLHPLLAAIRRIRKIGFRTAAEVPNGNGRKLDIARRPCLDQFPGFVARRDIRRVALRLVTISPALRQRGRAGSGRWRCNWDRTPIVRAGLYVRIETSRILAKEPCRREGPIISRFGGARRRVRLWAGIRGRIRARKRPRIGRGVWAGSWAARKGRSDNHPAVTATACAPAMATAIRAMMTPMAASPGKCIVRCERERRKKA